MADLQGDLVSARDLLAHAVGLAIAAEEPGQIAYISAALADIQCELGCVAEAAALYEQSLAASERIGAAVDLFVAHVRLGRVRRHLGDLERALCHYPRAVDLEADVRRTEISHGTIKVH